MSKLLKEASSVNPKDIANSVFPINSANVVATLKKCQSIVGEHTTAVFKAYVETLDEVLNEGMDNARSNQEVTFLMDLQRLIKRHRDEFEKYFTGYVSECYVKFKRKDLDTRLGQEEGSTLSMELSLVENDDLDETIAITTLTQRCDSIFAESLWALNQRFSVLNNGEPITDASNPASPIQYCVALQRTFKLIDLPPKDKARLYKVFGEFLNKLVESVCNDLNALFVAEGILPNLKYAVSKSSSDASGSEKQDRIVKAEVAAVNHAELMTAIRDLQKQLQISQGAVANLPPGMVAATNQELVQAFQHMQTSSESVVGNVDDSGTFEAADIASISAQVQAQVNESNSNASVQRSDMQTIDLVGMLFDYMLNDDRIPSNVKALLSHLHTPFLKVAFLDPEFFENEAHPARSLLNVLAEAGTKWSGNDGSSQGNVLERIKDTVQSIIKNFTDDVSMLEQLQDGFVAYLRNVERRSELMERRATESAEGEDRLRDVKIHVNTTLHERIDGRAVPSSVLLFVLQPWTDFLVFNLLRFGEDSPEWKRALNVVDDILWALGDTDKGMDDEQQKAWMQTTLAEVEGGFAAIAYPPAKSETLLSTLAEVLETSFGSQSITAASDDERAEIEGGSLSKLPEISQDVEMSEEEARIVESLKMMEFGTWLEMEDGQRLKVAWSNSRTSNYMLVNQLGQRETMITGVDLARKMLKKQARIISGSSKPFFDRALENIFDKLKDKAGEAEVTLEDHVEG